MKLMPERPTPEMMQAIEDAMTNPTVGNAKAASWDALVAYRAAWAVAPNVKANKEQSE